MSLPKPNWGWASLPFLLLIWIALASRFPTYILPQPWDVAREALRWLGDRSLLQHLQASVLEEVGAFARR